MKFFRTPTTFIFVALSFCVVSLSGCLTTYDDMLGSGPLTLTAKTQRYFLEYQSRNPMVFAVSEDGFYSEYIYCPETKCIPSNQAMYRAIRACEERARGKKCKVFAINDKIVWKGFEGQIKTTLTDDTSKISRVMNPIQLTGKQETGLKDYNKSLLENPDWRGGFAVARDGSYGWVTYPKETESAEVVSVIDAIGSCESYTSLSCSLFAQDRLLVYNDLSIDSYFYQKEAASTSASQPSSTEREI